MASTFPTSLDVFTNPTATSLLTSPSHALQHSDINDAVEALQTKVAIGNTVLGTYTAYTPTWVGMTIGNATVVSEYARVNNFVHYWGKAVWGSTTTITGGAVNLTLPILAGTSSSDFVGLTYGTITYSDASTGLFYKGEGRSQTANNQVRLGVYSITSSQVLVGSANATTPFTWVSTDSILWNFYYEAA